MGACVCVCVWGGRHGWVSVGMDWLGGWVCMSGSSCMCVGVCMRVCVWVLSRHHLVKNVFDRLSQALFA